MIQVYGVHVDRQFTEHERLTAIEYLTPERKAKALRFRRLKDQEKGILTGLLEEYAIRTTLDDSFSAEQERTMQQGIAPAGYTIRQGKEGKPYIVEYPELHYNISHAGDWIVCGIGDEFLGIDVEREERYSRRIVERFFHPEEQEDIFAQGSEEQERAAFAEYWVMKESFMKLSGAGFAVPIGSFHCNRKTGAIYLTEKVPEEWQQKLREAGWTEERNPVCRFLSVGNGYRCAICTIPDLQKSDIEEPDNISLQVCGISELVTHVRSIHRQSGAPDRSGRTDFE